MEAQPDGPEVAHLCGPVHALRLLSFSVIADLLSGLLLATGKVVFAGFADPLFHWWELRGLHSSGGDVWSSSDASSGVETIEHPDIYKMPFEITLL